MKKLLIALTAGGLLALMVLPTSAQRGDLYGGRALLALEQAFKASGVLTFPNYAAAPVACNAANRGVYYYDTATGQALVCGAAGWVAAGMTVGTADTIPKWNGTPDDLEDSSFVNAGVPVAGAGGSIVTMYETVLAMNNDDEVVGLDIQITNANHGGANNFLQGLKIWGTIGDPQADEWAMSLGTGWDASIFGNTTVLMLGSTLDVVSIVDYANYGAVFQFDTLAVAGASYTAAFFAPTFAIMDGADTSIGLYLSMTTADHTGGPNVNNLYGINIEDITNDDDTIEYALVTETGWDVDIWNLDADLMLGSGTQTVAVVDDTYGQVWVFDSAMAAGASNDFETIVANIAIMDGVGVGGDVARGIFLDISNADHTDAGTGNVLYGLDIDEIVGDAEATETAINIQDGWDAAIHISDGNIANDAFCLGDSTCALDAAIFFNAGTLTVDIDGTAANTFTFYQSTSGLASLQNTGSGNNVTIDIRNALNVGFDMLYIDSNSIFATDGSDIVNMLHLDWNETDWATATETLNAIRIDTITQDAQGTYNAISFGTTWDYDLNFDTSGEMTSPTFQSTGTVADIDHGITQHWLMDPTLTANDNASDQRNVLLIDVVMPNGSAGLVNAINIDGVTDDPETIDSAIFVEAGWDSALTITNKGGVATTNALTGTVNMYLDDDADYAGDGGNDCAIVFRDAAGGMSAFLIVVNGGVCP